MCTNYDHSIPSSNYRTSWFHFVSFGLIFLHNFVLCLFFFLICFFFFLNFPSDSFFFSKLMILSLFESCNMATTQRSCIVAWRNLVASYNYCCLEFAFVHRDENRVARLMANGSCCNGNIYLDKIPLLLCCCFNKWRTFLFFFKFCE